MCFASHLALLTLGFPFKLAATFFRTTPITDTNTHTLMQWVSVNEKIKGSLCCVLSYVQFKINPTNVHFQSLSALANAIKFIKVWTLIFAE